MAKAPLIAFYGDDFTGSTDALESLAAAGLKALLFTGVPSPELLARFEGLEAIGIAGSSRGMTPDEMAAVMPGVIEALKATGAPILHYKVCSTFDSSPSIGSFGRVMDIAKHILGPATIPIVVGAPKLGRYSLFGTLFARHNVDNTVHRIDRHPTMSVHPTTPMREADMRRHIGLQTSLTIGLLPAPAIAGSSGKAIAALDAALALSPDALLIDIADEAGEAAVGLILETLSLRAAPLFVVGSSGVQYAMVARWREDRRLPEAAIIQTARPVDRLLAISGSCSPATGAQIRQSVSDGFAQIALDPVAILTEPENGPAVQDAVARSVALLESGQSVVVHSSTGNDDTREAQVASHFARLGVSEQHGRLQGGRMLAHAAGLVLAQVLDRVPLSRFLVAGGDTSTTAIKLLGLDALEMVAPLAPGAPLCRILAPGRALDGTEVVLKGGQMGGPSYFSQVKEGRL